LRVPEASAGAILRSGGAVDAGCPIIPANNATVLLRRVLSVGHAQDRALALTPADDLMKLQQAEYYLKQEKVGEAERIAA